MTQCTVLNVKPREPSSPQPSSWRKASFPASVARAKGTEESARESMCPPYTSFVPNRMADLWMICQKCSPRLLKL